MSHSDQIAKVASFYQRDAAAKARVFMLNACYLQYPDFDWEVVKRHLQASEIDRRVNKLRRSDPLLQTPVSQSQSPSPAPTNPASSTPALANPATSTPPPATSKK